MQIKMPANAKTLSCNGVVAAILRFRNFTILAKTNNL